MNFIDLFVQSFPRFISGLGVTLQITVISLVLAMVLGFVSCFLCISKWKALNFIGNAYIWAIRGTPILVQAFFIYFGLPQLLNAPMPAMTAGIITCTLNAGAYLSEIFRSGISAVDKGQMEAARSLGMPYANSMAKVILPQAVRVVIPSVINQCIITLKDTSILSAIGLVELTQTGSNIVARNMESFKTWTIVALFYLVIISILAAIGKRLERSLHNGRKN